VGPAINIVRLQKVTDRYYSQHSAIHRLPFRELSFGVDTMGAHSITHNEFMFRAATQLVMRCRARRGRTSKFGCEDERSSFAIRRGIRPTSMRMLTAAKHLGDTALPNARYRASFFAFSASQFSNEKLGLCCKSGSYSSRSK